VQVDKMGEIEDTGENIQQMEKNTGENIQKMEESDQNKYTPTTGSNNSLELADSELGSSMTSIPAGVIIVDPREVISSSTLAILDLDSSDHPENGGRRRSSVHSMSAKGRSKGKCDNFKGILLALLSTFTYSLSTVLLKILINRSNYHPFTVSVWRFQGMVIPSIFILARHLFVNRKNKKGTIWNSIFPVTNSRKALVFIIALILIRSVVSASSIVLQNYAVGLLNLADASVIVYSFPVFVIFMAHFILKERADLCAVFIAIFTFMGVVVVARPPLIFGDDDGFNEDTLKGTLFAVGSMLLFSVVYIIMRYLRDIHYSIIILVYGIVATIECVFLAWNAGVLDIPHGSEEWALAAGLILFTFLGQTLFVISLQFEQAGPVALMQTTDVIFSFINQFVFLQVVPDEISIGGALIVVTGVSLTTLRKWAKTLPEESRIRKYLFV
jgi:drug/metabolite transporter (DMT)-like permease